MNSHNAVHKINQNPWNGDVSMRTFIKNYKLLLAKERDDCPNRNLADGSKEQRIHRMVILNMEESDRQISCQLSPATRIEKEVEIKENEIEVEKNNPLRDATVFPSGDLVALEKRNEPGLSEELASVTSVTLDCISICFTDPNPSFPKILKRLISNGDLVTVRRHEPQSNHKRHWDAMNDIDYLNPSPMLQSLFGLAPTPELPDLDKIETPFCNKDLNRIQRETVKFCLAQPHLAVVHGPPGTGKTTTLVEIVLQMLIDKKKILLCAPSNSAVDNIAVSLLHSKYLPKLSRLHDLKERKKKKLMRTPNIVRLVATGREVPPEVEDWTMDALLQQTEYGRTTRLELKRQLCQLECEMRLKGTRMGGARYQNCRQEKAIRHIKREMKEARIRAQTQVLHSADVVISTLTGAHKNGFMRLFASNHFDAVVIDECGQAIEAESWIALKHSEKCILAGDHLQLPPFVKSHRAAKLGLDRSLLERVARVSNGCYVRLLTTQYRMNRTIMDWTNKEMYDGQLVADPSVASHLLNDIEGVEDNEFTSSAMVLIDTHSCQYHESIEEGKNDYKLGSSKCDDMNSFWAETRYDNKSICNEHEIVLVVDYITALYSFGVKEEDIAVISPYAAQVDLLTTYLGEIFPDVEIKTVDSYQGREKEVVILSMTRSNPDNNIGFLSDRRRLNVAITRARRHVAVICDTETVCCDEFIRGLVVHTMKRGLVSKAQYCNKQEEDETLYFLSGLSHDVEDMVEEVNSRPMKQTTPKGDALQDLLMKFAEGFPLKFANSPSICDYRISSDGTCLTFSKDYDNNFRYAVHAFAETIGMRHFSEGEKDLRQVSVMTDKVYDGNVRERGSKRGARKDWYPTSSDDDACKFETSQTDDELENEFKELTLKRKARKQQVDSKKGGKSEQLMKLKAKLATTKKEESTKNSTQGKFESLATTIPGSGSHKLKKQMRNTPEEENDDEKTFGVWMEVRIESKEVKKVENSSSHDHIQPSEMKVDEEELITKEEVAMNVECVKVDQVNDVKTPQPTQASEMKPDKEELTKEEVEMNVECEKGEQVTDVKSPQPIPASEMKPDKEELTKEEVEMNVECEKVEQVTDVKSPPPIPAAAEDEMKENIKEPQLPLVPSKAKEEKSTRKEKEVAVGTCGTCSKQIALSNLTEHQERCASFAERRKKMQNVVTTNTPPTTTSTSTSNDGDKRKQNKQKINNNKKKQVQQRKKDEDMDEDALLDAAIAENHSCPQPKCGTSTNVTGVVCVQCHKKFCFKHLLPEIHGCGARAKSSSRGQFVTAGGQVVYSTSAANSKSKTAQTRRAVLHHALEKNIDSKINTRSTKKKKK